MDHPQHIVLELMIESIYTTIHGILHSIKLLCRVLDGRLMYESIEQTCDDIFEGPHLSPTVDTFDVIVKPGLGLLVKIHRRECDTIMLMFGACIVVDLHPPQHQVKPAIKLLNIFVT
jgi:hypothetical protein